MLEEASQAKDAAARTELVIKAAILHHLALLREAGQQIAPLPLRETPSFARAKVEAQILGQGGEKRGLRGGPPALERAREAYEARSAPEGASPKAGRLKL